MFADNFCQEYEKIILGRLDDKIIEKMPKCEMNLYGNYLPH